MTLDDQKTVLSSVPFLTALAVFLVALCARVVFVGAPMGSDDAIYFDLGSRLSPDIFDTARAQWPFRTGMVLPMALSQSVFGYTVWAYYVFSVGFSVCAVMLTYLVVRQIASPRAAVVSSLVFATSALALYHGTHVLPDTPNLCGLLLAFYLFSKVENPKGRRNLMLLGFAAGAAFYGHLVRMPNSVFLAALPAYEWIRFRSLRRTITFSIFFAGFIALECVFYLAMTGNPFKRIMLVPKGVTLWIKHQGSLSWTNYLLGPFEMITSFTTGWILLCAGAIGAAVAIARRHAAMIGLLVGGTLIFLAYSYPVTSVDPLVRALPLQPRYIIAFTCVLAILVGYLFDNLQAIPYVARPLPRYVVPVSVALLLVLQARELPRLPNTAFFNDDAYVVASRVVRDFTRTQKLEAPVHAYPAAVFKMFGGYSTLNLIAYSPTKTPIRNRFYLVNRPRLIRTARGARLGKKLKLAENCELLLSRGEDVELLFDGASITLLYLRGEPVASSADLAQHADIWHAADGITRDAASTARGQSFAVAPLASKSYLSMFETGFDRPSHQEHAIHQALEPGVFYRLDVRYRLRKSFTSLRLTMRQFGAEEAVASETAKLARTAGEHEFWTTIRADADYRSFRVFWRLANRAEDNELQIVSMTLTPIR